MLIALSKSFIRMNRARPIMHVMHAIMPIFEYFITNELANVLPTLSELISHIIS